MYYSVLYYYYLDLLVSDSAEGDSVVRQLVGVSLQDSQFGTDPCMHE